MNNDEFGTHSFLNLYFTHFLYELLVGRGPLQYMFVTVASEDVRMKQLQHYIRVSLEKLNKNTENIDTETTLSIVRISTNRSLVVMSVTQHRQNPLECILKRVRKF
jgi:hypothetical protein